MGYNLDLIFNKKIGLLIEKDFEGKISQLGRYQIFLKGTENEGYVTIYDFVNFLEIYFKSKDLLQEPQRLVKTVKLLCKIRKLEKNEQDLLKSASCFQRILNKIYNFFLKIFYKKDKILTEIDEKQDKIQNEIEKRNRDKLIKHLNKKYNIERQKPLFDEFILFIYQSESYETECQKSFIKNPLFLKN